jgi:hypothetical protein
MQLEEGQIAQVGSTSCGYVNNSWVPGKLLKNGKFLSYSMKWNQLVVKGKKVGGTKGRKLLARGKNFKKKHKRELGTCSNLQNSGGGSGEGSNGGSGSGGGGASAGALHFNLSGAVGLAITGSADQRFRNASSNLMKVSEIGELEEVIDSGAANISKFLIAPNNKLYALFESRVNLVTGTVSYSEDGCLLAEVDTETGEPTCVESQPNTQIFWETGSANAPIQFDADGAVYYVAWNWSTGVQIMRRYLDGEKVDLINDGMELLDFLVLGDKTIFLSGQSLSTRTSWVRRLSPEGSLKNVVTSESSNFLRLFPDGNVYFGAWTDEGPGVDRYLVQEDRLDSMRWIGADWGQDARYHSDDFCMDEQFNYLQNGFCSYRGAYITDIHETLSNKVYAIAGSSWDGKKVPMQYYPEVQRVETVVHKTLVSQVILNHLLLAGLDQEDVNVMTLLDTSDGSEIQLIGAENEVEVYHANFSAGNGKIYFDGLRFADNTYVIGHVDMQSLQVTVSPTGGAQLVDFQTFQ